MGTEGRAALTCFEQIKTTKQLQLLSEQTTSATLFSSGMYILNSFLV